MNRILIAFATFISFTTAQAATTAPTLDQIKAHYRGVTEFRAEVEQTKTSPLLIRPLKSKVQLGLDHDTLSWQPQGQDAWKVRFVGNDLEFLGADRSMDKLPPDARLKLNKTMGLVRDLLTMDPRLDAGFDLILKDNHLSIKPKPANKDVLFQAVTIVFKNDLQPESIGLDTQDDHTELKFISLSIKK